MLRITQAHGKIELADGTIIECKGYPPFDLMTIPDMNDITILHTDEFKLELDSGNTISFPDAQGLRLFMGHNKMLNESERRKDLRMEIENEISGYKYQMGLISESDLAKDRSMIEYYKTAIDQCKARLLDC